MVFIFIIYFSILNIFSHCLLACIVLISQLLILSMLPCNLKSHFSFRNFKIYLAFALFIHSFIYFGFQQFDFNVPACVSLSIYLTLRSLISLGFFVYCPKKFQSFLQISILPFFIFTLSETPITFTYFCTFDLLGCALFSFFLFFRLSIPHFHYLLLQ